MTRPRRLYCTAYGCTRAVAVNGFFCDGAWLRIPLARRELIVVEDRAGRGERVAEAVRSARRELGYSCAVLLEAIA